MAVEAFKGVQIKLLYRKLLWWKYKKKHEIYNIEFSLKNLFTTGTIPFLQSLPRPFHSSFIHKPYFKTAFPNSHELIKMNTKLEKENC